MGIFDVSFEKETFAVKKDILALFSESGDIG